MRWWSEMVIISLLAGVGGQETVDSETSQWRQAQVINSKASGKHGHPGPGGQGGEVHAWTPGRGERWEGTFPAHYLRICPWYKNDKILPTDTWWRQWFWGFGRVHLWFEKIIAADRDRGTAHGEVYPAWSCHWFGTKSSVRGDGVNPKACCLITTPLPLRWSRKRNPESYTDLEWKLQYCSVFWTIKEPQ